MPAPAAPAADVAPAPVDRSRASSVHEELERERLRRRQQQRSVQVGASLGLGAPGGYVGAFAEVDPWRHGGVSWAVGQGSTGTAIATTVWLRPLPAADDQRWVLGVGPSVNLTPPSQRGRSDQWVPPAAWWLNVEVASEWRLSNGRFIRFGVGHAWLTNGSSFRCNPGVSGLCQAASESNVAGWSPYGGGSLATSDMVVAHGQDKRVHLWFVHVDLGMLIGL